MKDENKIQLQFPGWIPAGACPRGGGGGNDDRSLFFVCAMRNNTLCGFSLRLGGFARDVFSGI
jgi:hypothetical protein